MKKSLVIIVLGFIVVTFIIVVIGIFFGPVAAYGEECPNCPKELVAFHQELMDALHSLPSGNFSVDFKITMSDTKDPGQSLVVVSAVINGKDYLIWQDARKRILSSKERLVCVREVVSVMEKIIKANKPENEPTRPPRMHKKIV